MDNCFLIVNKIAKNKAKDHISLSYDERFLRRKKLVSDNGFEFLVNLPAVSYTHLTLPTIYSV